MKITPPSLPLGTACLALFCATILQLKAATLIVTNTADSGSGSLRAALTGAADGDTISAAGISGIITLTAGELPVSRSVTLLGPGAGALTVSGNNASRVFNVTGTNVTISGLTIADGFSDENGAGINAAGGTGAVLTVSGCVLTNNSTSLNGGGIHNSPGVALTVSNCSICGNVAEFGGGIYSAAKLTINASTLKGNSAFMGGGLCSDCAFGSAILSISTSTLDSNSAIAAGGGIFNRGYPGSANLSINSSTLSGNAADSGGGIYNWTAGSGSATLTIRASTLSGNSANSLGGGIVNAGDYNAKLTISASTLSGNSAGSLGGGVYNSCNNGVSFSIGDTILNAGVSGANIYNSGTASSGGYNLCSDNGGGCLTSPRDRINTDPRLGPLQDNGGPTWTHALLAGSPAIDNGKTNAVPTLVSATDQRGLPRPVDNPYIANAAGGDGSDIGAAEMGYFVVTDVANSGSGSLRAALAGAENGDVIDATGVSGTITLTTGELSVPTSVTLLGPGPGALTVSGNNASRVFNVTGANVVLSGLTTADGYSDQNGAGIYAGPGSVLTLSDCVITNSHTTLDGGGLYNAGTALNLTNCTLSGSTAGGSGGGIFSSNSILTIVASTISLNTAGTAGGGIMNDSESGATATLTILASTLNNNTATWGGGIENGVGAFSGGYATVTIDSSTISGNSAGGGDGGISCGGAWGGHVALKLNASTLYGNSGFSIYSDGRFAGGTATVEIGDTILNAGALGYSLYNQPGGSVTSYGCNLSSDDAGGFLTATGDQINTDPMLGPLQDNGGPTWTHALLAGSPALDSGKTNAVPGLACATDQRGLPRLADFATIPNGPGADGSDIGACEFQNSQPTLVTTVDDSGPGSLREALADAAVNDTIHFAVSGTIALTSGELSVPSSVALLGPGAGALTVSGNNASRVFNVTGTNVTISGLTIADGFTDQTGAGVYAAGGPGSVLTLSGCVITNSHATLDGGGLYNSPGTTTLMSNCTVTVNSAGRSGGGILNESATLKFFSSTINSNSAVYYGGALMNLSPGTSSTVMIKAGTFSSNSAAAGAGLMSYGPLGTATLTIHASTFSGNWGGNGSIHVFMTTLEIGDSILKDRTIGGNLVNLSGTVVSDGYNLSSDGAGGFLTSVGDRINTDPRLGPLQDNGGPTWTHALLPGSPAIDQGKANAVPALACAIDQRGLPRPADFATVPNATGGDGSDIGAFEFENSQPTLVTTIDDSGPGSLREALADAAVNDTIHFAVSGTIALTSGELSVPSSVTLLGAGAGALKVSGNNASRVFNVTGTNVTISGLTIADGFTDQTGAGVYAAGGPGSVLTLSGCIITNNNANDFGGGLYNSPGGTMTVSNCAIAGNSTTRSGGGIYNDTATLKVIASTLSGNSAIMGGDGGGILNYAAPGQSATLTVSGSTLSGNVAGLGGGIGNIGVGANATAVVSASTFSSNVGPFGGGGIYNWGLFGIATVEIGDTILNAGISGGNFYNDNGVVTSDGYNLSSDDGGGFLTATGDRVHTDPKLGPLQDNGGPTWTHALLAGSPALDNGKTNAVPALASATDQRDLPRPVDNPYLANAAGGDGSDIGAYEVQGSGGYDIDTDGLPDFWELAWFGNLSQSGTDDSDGTGQNNLFKFTAGLDPTDPTSVFKLRIEAVAGQPNQRHLIFSPWAAGRTYTPQFTTNLAVTAFAPLTGYGGPTTNGTEVTITDPNAGVQQKFYRMQISVP